MTSGSDAERAYDRECALWEAFRASDSVALERLIDERVRDAGPGGVLTRADVLDAVARMSIVGYSIDEFELATFDDVEIVVYRSTVDGLYNGNPFPARLVQCSTVWKRFGDDWRVVHRHESPMRTNTQTPESR